MRDIFSAPHEQVLLLHNKYQVRQQGCSGGVGEWEVGSAWSCLQRLLLSLLGSFGLQLNRQLVGCSPCQSLASHSCRRLTACALQKRDVYAHLQPPWCDLPYRVGDAGRPQRSAGGWECCTGWDLLRFCGALKVPLVE